MAFKKQTKNFYIGFLILSLLGCTFIFGLFIWCKFNYSPLIHINFPHRQISLLGGRIDIQSEEGFVKIGSSYFNHHFEGLRDFSKYKKTIYIYFALGNFTFINSENSELKWNCKSLKEIENEDYIREKNTKISFKFEKMGNLNCEISIPAKSQVYLQGIQGKAYIKSPQFKFSGKIRNGKVIHLE